MAGSPGSHLRVGALRYAEGRIVLACKEYLTLNGYDIDGVLSLGHKPVAPYVVVSGRTWHEVVPLDLDPAPLAIAPRGVGDFGDHKAAAEWKSLLINHWGVTTFYDDDEYRVSIIRANCPNCEVVLVR